MAGFPHNPVNRKTLGTQIEYFEPQKCQLAKFGGICWEDPVGNSSGTL